VPHNRLSSGDIERSNLVLFGRPRANAVLRRIIHRLPVEITRRGIRIGRRAVTGDDLGLRMIYPNPLNPDRYVVLMIGHLPTRVKDMEALPWLLPDYAVFDAGCTPGRTVHPYWESYDAAVEAGEIAPETFPEDDKPILHLPDCFLAAGLFDRYWQP
jgi:hypothetical protein